MKESLVPKFHTGSDFENHLEFLSWLREEARNIEFDYQRRLLQRDQYIGQRDFKHEY